MIVDDNELPNEIFTGRMKPKVIAGGLSPKEINEIGIAYAEAGITGKPSPQQLILIKS